MPSFYRLKIKSDLENSCFTGDVYITIRASKRVKEIVLHSKNLSINKNAKLTEQIYEKVEPLHTKVKRQVHIEATNDSVPTNDTAPGNNTLSTNTTQTNDTTPLNNNTVQTNDTVATNFGETSNGTIQSVINAGNVVNETVPASTSAPPVKAPTTVDPYLSVDTQTQVTHSSTRNIKILSISEAAGDRLILTLASTLKPDVDYTLELSFEGKISNSLTGFYKSSYTNNQNEVQ